MKITIKSIAYGAVILCCLAVTKSWAQQEALYTQYMYNTQLLNPAYTGSRGFASLNTLYRSQWVGLEGAPRTISFGANTKISEKHTAWGISAFNDKIGPSSESNIAVDYAYTLTLSDGSVDNKTYLAFGLKGGINTHKVDYSKLAIYDLGDSDIAGAESRFSPIIGTGAYLYTNTWYLGLSTPNFLTTSQFNEVKYSRVDRSAHYYLMGGMVFDLGPSTKLKPAMLTKFTNGAPISLDLSANMLFNEKFGIGASYRFGYGVSALCSFRVKQSIMLGYAYDLGVNNLGSYNSGSHEVFLRFDFVSLLSSYVNPRFF